MSVWFSLLAILSVVGGSVLSIPAAPIAPTEIPPTSAVISISPSAGAPAPGTTLAVTETAPMTGTVRIATLIASYFDRQVEEILDLHGEELGFGGIAKALFTAVEADTSLEEILEMRLQGLGWGEIRKTLGLHPGMPHASLGQIISQGQGRKGPDWVPPGQRKQMGTWTPPGQNRKDSSGPASNPGKSNRGGH